MSQGYQPKKTKGFEKKNPPRGGSGVPDKPGVNPHLSPEYKNKVETAFIPPPSKPVDAPKPKSLVQIRKDELQAKMDGYEAAYREEPGDHLLNLYMGCWATLKGIEAKEKQS